MKPHLDHDRTAPHWPESETASGVTELRANTPRRFRGRTRDVAREVGAWCLVLMALIAGWSALVAFIKFLSK